MLFVTDPSSDTSVRASLRAKPSSLAPRTISTDGRSASLGMTGFSSRQLPPEFLRSMSTDPDSRAGFGPYLQGVGPTYNRRNEQRIIRYNHVEDLQEALELHGKNVAAFLIEPIQGEAGYATLHSSPCMTFDCSSQDCCA